MRKYNKSVRKNIKKHKYSRRGHRGGYWFYPSPGDDEHVFTKLKRKLFPSSTPSFNEMESTTITSVSTPVEEETPVPEPPMSEAPMTSEAPAQEENRFRVPQILGEA